MKKMFLVLALLMFASQAIAGTVTLTLVRDVTNPHLGVLSYSASGNVSGLGLNITVDTADANIVDINSYFVGECGGPGNRGFGIFPASFSREIDAADPNWDDPDYTPVAAATDAGAAGTGLGTGTIIIEMGALYEDGNAPPTSGTLCKILVDGDCNVTVTGDATRGNVVMEDGSQASLTPATSVFLGEPVDDGPECWSWLTHCHGNATDLSGGVGYVNLDDFYAFSDSFVKTYDDDWNDGAGPYNPCADFDNSGKVNLDDFYILSDNFVSTPDSDCTPASWPPPSGPY